MNKLGINMQSKSLKIISLNIEFDRHLKRIIPFFKEEQPDVIILQEVLDKNIAYLEESTGKKGIYTVQNIIGSDESECRLGMLTLTNLPVLKHYSKYYRGDGTQPTRMQLGEPEKTTRGIAVTNILKENKLYCLVNTHFTWSPNGKPNEKQHDDVKILLKYLSNIPDFALCGDFNAPRGTAIFEIISSKYKDNIPLEVRTTIDKTLHKAGDLGIVVDGLFTTPNYQVDTIKIVDNLSDHCAIVATITHSQ